MRRISCDVKEGIAQLFSQGFSTRKIAEKLNLGRETIRRHLPQELVSSPRKSPGRPRKLSIRLKSVFTRNFVNGKLKSLAGAKNDLMINHNVDVSKQTIMRFLHHSGLRSYAKTKKPRLTLKHRRNRLLFARAHSSWSVDNWKHVIFTDESKFNLYGPDGNKRVWRHSGSVLLDHHVHQIVKFGGGHVMVWGCITYNGVGQLAFIDSTMNASLFVRVLSACIPLTCCVHDLDLGSIILQQDNDPKHTSRIAKEYLQQQEFTTMTWPSCSPDMNIIEHVWDDVNRRLRSQYPGLTNKEELRAALSQTWYSTPIEYIRALYDSMPRRIDALNRARGSFTKY
jgi:transposase